MQSGPHASSDLEIELAASLQDEQSGRATIASIRSDETPVGVVPVSYWNMPCIALQFQSSTIQATAGGPGEWVPRFVTVLLDTMRSM